MQADRLIGVLGAVAILSLCGGPLQLAAQNAGEPPRSFPLAKTQPDRGPSFSFAPSNSFHLEFGRGSGWHGLDTVAIDHIGNTLLYRHRSENVFTIWERAELKLSTAAIQRISKSILELRLLAMARMYHANVHDGEQWVFWLQQAGQSKSVYFNNHFPAAIQKFAVLLDSELQQAGIAKTKWQKVPAGTERDHETAIWQSLKDRP